MRDTLITTAEAAAHLGVDPATVARYLKSGRLTPVRIGAAGRSVRISANEVEALMRERASQSPPRPKVRTTLGAEAEPAGVWSRQGVAESGLGWGLVQASDEVQALRRLTSTFDCVLFDASYLEAPTMESKSGGTRMVFDRSAQTLEILAEEIKLYPGGATGGRWGKGPMPLDLYLDRISETLAALPSVLHERSVVFVAVAEGYVDMLGNVAGVAIQTPKPGTAQAKETPRGSLMGLPSRVVEIVRRQGWALRSSIVFSRRNSVPLGMAGLPKTTLSTLLMLSPSGQHYFDPAALEGTADNWTDVGRESYAFGSIPQGVLQRCVRCASPEGGRVLSIMSDPTAAVLATLAEGRSAFAIETGADRTSLLARRIEAA